MDGNLISRFEETEKEALTRVSAVMFEETEA
jgi:hypothetical protein